MGPTSPSTMPRKAAELHHRRDALVLGLHLDGMVERAGDHVFAAAHSAPAAPRVRHAREKVGDRDVEALVLEVAGGQPVGDRWAADRGTAWLARRPARHFRTRASAHRPVRRRPRRRGRARGRAIQMRTRATGRRWCGSASSCSLVGPKPRYRGPADAQGMKMSIRPGAHVAAHHGEIQADDCSFLLAAGAAATARRARHRRADQCRPDGLLETNSSSGAPAGTRRYGGDIRRRCSPTMRRKIRDRAVADQRLRGWRNSAEDLSPGDAGRYADGPPALRLAAFARRPLRRGGCQRREGPAPRRRRRKIDITAFASAFSVKIALR